MIYLSRSDVEALFDESACIPVLRSAFEAVAEKAVDAPQRTVIRMSDRSGFFGSMPVYARGYGSAAKVMSIYPENHDKGLPSHQGYILLFAEDGGEPQALIEAGSVTKIRTAAASGLATDILSNLNAQNLCILGSGVQARSHVRAMLAVRDIATVCVWSRTRSHADKFAAWVRDQADIGCEVADTATDALVDADVVCTVTASADPIVSRAEVPDSCHINAVGSFTPTNRELSTDLVQDASLFVDSRESALRESGDILIPIEERAIGQEHIKAELSELVTGHPGRNATNELTVFKSLGVAIEDLAAAKAVYDRAGEQGVGVVIDS